jgi:hypothetical protein
MKKIFFIFSFALLVLTSCDKRNLEYGETFDRLKAMDGTFKLTSIVQTDEVTTDLANKQLDISDLIGANPLTISFTKAGGITVTQNDSPDFLGFGTNVPSTWTFDDASYPTQIITNAGVTLNLGKPVNQFTTGMEFKRTKMLRGKKAVSYVLTFVKL